MEPSPLSPKIIGQKLAACFEGDVPHEVRVVDMPVSADNQRYRLIGENDHCYEEACTNQFTDIDGPAEVRFLGTGRHQGGIVLRPLYILIDGTWYNISTGKPAPDWMQNFN